MAIWITLLVTYFLVPLIMILTGQFMISRPPKTINSLIGYRTTRSSQSQEAWNFAQTYSGKLLRKWGLIWTGISILLFTALLGLGSETVGTAGTILCLVQTVFLIVPIFTTEKKLKETFGTDGRPKE